MEKISNRRWGTLSIICLILGAVLWLPNFLFQYGYSIWLLTFLVNPIGVLFGVLGKSKVGIISNTLMTFSFFIFMFFGYFFGAIFSR
ncbi:hypothetical protein [Oceanobacillus massiliensis]|uniref:hypothetical protein n=1 Tax=Oceanobacillus massiliensis TaxID=1465765 RepID=UPI0002890748|nr:hypothetical protein [Oceanobacillus massiliensis]